MIEMRPKMEAGLGDQPSLMARGHWERSWDEGLSVFTLGESWANLSKLVSIGRGQIITG